MFKIFNASLVVILMSGCSNVSLSDFEKPDPNVLKNQKITVGFINNKTGLIDSDELINSNIDENDKLKSIISNECKNEKVEKTALGIAFLPAVGKFLFDQYMDNQIKKANDLIKAAQNTYSCNIILDDASLDKYDCILIARHNPNTDQKSTNVGLVALLKINKFENFKNAITISPIYIKANNATVITKRDENISAANKINLSFGISVKTIANKKDAPPALVEVGKGSVSVPNVQIGPKGGFYECKEKECPTSDLIAYPSGIEEKNPVSISFAVGEAGIGVDLNQSITELKAIKAAMGPVVQTSVGELFKK